MPSLIFIIFFEDKNLDTQRSPCLYSSTDIKNNKEIIESIQSSKIGHKGSDTSQTGEFNYIKNIKFIFSSRVNNYKYIFKKNFFYRFIYVLCYLFHHYCLLLQEFNIGEQIIIEMS